MASIVVLGAGIGGMSVAYELRALLGKEHAVTVVGEGGQFSFTPSNPWVAVGWRKPSDIQIGVRPHLAKKGIGFEDVGAEQVLPERNTLRLRDGRSVRLIGINAPEKAMVKKIAVSRLDEITVEISGARHQLRARSRLKTATSVNCANKNAVAEPNATRSDTSGPNSPMIRVPMNEQMIPARKPARTTRRAVIRYGRLMVNRSRLGAAPSRP